MQAACTHDVLRLLNDDPPLTCFMWQHHQLATVRRYLMPGSFPKIFTLKRNKANVKLPGYTLFQSFNPVRLMNDNVIIDLDHMLARSALFNSEVDRAGC